MTKNLQEGDTVSKTIMRDGNLVVATCKFTPSAEDGKEFHCDFDSPSTESNLEQTTVEPVENPDEAETNTFETTSIMSPSPEGSASDGTGSGADAENHSPPNPPKLPPSPNPVQIFTGGSREAGMAPQDGNPNNGEPLCATLDSRCRAVISAIGHLVTPPDASDPHCKPLDEACRALQGKLLFPPKLPAKAASPPLSADPCDSNSDCVSWRFLRMVAAPFLAALKGPGVALDKFPTDEASLFSVEGAKLYRLALSQAADSQHVDQPFLLRMVYRSQLDSLLQDRYARVEMQVSLSRMLWLSVGLALPSVLLSSVYLLIHLRWAIVNRREKLQAKKTSRDQRLLQEYQRGEANPRPLS